MTVITDWIWDFGDGNTSTEQNPFHIYMNPGYYDVYHSVRTDTGSVYSVTKTDYIRVYDFSDAIWGYNLSEDRSCLVYGNGKFGGSGWSVFTGDNWLWPETRGSILNIRHGERPSTEIIWDFDTGLPFVINSDDRHITGDVFRDKVGHPSVEEGFPIESKIITPAYIGERKKFRIKHEETFLALKPIRQAIEYPYSIDLDTSLLGDNHITVREKMHNLNPNQEVLFSTKKKFDWFQVALDFSESGYSLHAINTTCKVSDTARYASKSILEDQQFQMYLLGGFVMYTRGNYDINYYNHSEKSNLQYIEVNGADGYDNSGARITDTFTIDTVEGDVMYLWTTTGNKIVNADTAEAVDYEILYEDILNFDWQFIKVPLGGIDHIGLGLGCTIFDLRVLDSTLDDNEHFKSYINDVILNNGIKFLPFFMG